MNGIKIRLNFLDGKDILYKKGLEEKPSDIVVTHCRLGVGSMTPSNHNFEVKTKDVKNTTAVVELEIEKGHDNLFVSTLEARELIPKITTNGRRIFYAEALYVLEVKENKVTAHQIEVALGSQDHIIEKVAGYCPLNKMVQVNPLFNWLMKRVKDTE